MKPDRNSSLWTMSAKEQGTTNPISRDEAVDMVVVGGGITGCAAALEAARMGSKVMLLEAQAFGFGGSGRNVGLVNAGLWLPPDTILKQMGDTDGARLIETLGEGPQRVFDIIEREGIDCEAVRAGTLHLAHSESGLEDLKERHRQGNRSGAPLQLIDKADADRRTGSTAFFGGLFDPRAGTIQPLSYCCGLARAAQKAGAKLCATSPVTSVGYKKGQWHLISNGHAVRATSLLVATNAYGGKSIPLVPSSFSVVHYSQFATDPLPERLLKQILPGGEGCWDTALVMSSIRLDRTGRLIIGGMGNSDGPGARIHKKWARRKLRSLFPEIGDIGFTHSWQGKIAMTADHIPKVVRLGPNGYAIFGYSGRGIAPGTVFGTSAAHALIENSPEAFPVIVSSEFSERFTTFKSAFYEVGATLMHVVR